MIKRAAVGLYSGGLDSLLALKIIHNLGFKVVAVHFVTPFTIELYKKEESKKSFPEAEDIIFLQYFLGKEYIELLKNPRYGYGKHFNPCIDCHLMMVKKAKVLMEEFKADFVFTGEVLGERPMSQRKDTLRIIERDSELDGRLLRPLSARLLEETIPEKEGIIDRNKLFAIQGRSRKEQLKLVKEFKIAEFQTPGGGCSLTEKHVSERVEDSLKHDEDTLFDMLLLRIGRHLRLPGGEKVVAGRDEGENERLLKFTRNKGIKLTVKDYSSSYIYLRETDKEEALYNAARVSARYSSVREKEKVDVFYWRKEKEENNIITIKPYSTEEVEDLII